MWGGVGRVIVLRICMGDVWRRVGGVVNRGGACVLRSGGYQVPGIWYQPADENNCRIGFFILDLSPFFGFEHIFRNRSCVVVLFIFFFLV